MRLALSGCLATLVAAFALFYFGPVSKGDAILMSTLEQEAVFGAATHDPGECIEDVEGGYCSQSSSAFGCDRAYQYCNEQKAKVVCTTEVAFYNPTRCKPVTIYGGTAGCDDSNPNNGTIACYGTRNCFCDVSGIFGEPFWECFPGPGDFTPSNVIQCVVSP